MLYNQGGHCDITCYITHPNLQDDAYPSANQTVTILYKRLYNSYKVVTSHQPVQPVQPVQLHLQILYKRFDLMLYNVLNRFLNGCTTL